MEKLKYISIHENYVLEETRFYIKVAFPPEPGHLIVLTRQHCKKNPNNGNFYIAELNLNKIDNHKILM
ncbi:hypothetical protein [Spiroplasma endosymbiont of Labia minor]|uniref:hypothetical protein n=1 Tax=Spiroplasma endosymbiont of Labia minor TaxID=3066305 RepID=UPI0030D0DB62